MQQPGEGVAHRVSLQTLLLQRDLAVALSTATDLTKALQAVLAAMVRLDGVDAGGVYLMDREDGRLDLVAHAGLSDAFLASSSSFAPDSPNAAIVNSGAAMYATYDRLAAVTQADEARRAEGLRASAVVPIAHDGRVIACLNLASRTLDEIPSESQALIETLAAQIGGAVARVRAEHEVRERGDDLRMVFDSLADFLFVLDDQGFIVQVNHAVLERLGYAEEELVGQHVLAVHPEARREEAQEIIRDMLCGERASCPVPLITRDGVLIPVETHVRRVSWRGRPALIGTSRDVTERERAEKALREQAAFIGSLLDALPDIVFLKDAQGRYITSNPPHLAFFGDPPGGVIGKTDRELFDPDTAALLMARDADAIARRETQHHEVWLTRADGRTILMDIIKTPYFGAEGELVGVLGVARDITPRQRREDEIRAVNEDLERRVKERTRQLTAANRELEEFVYSVSHDLRTPLRAVDGFSHSVLEEFGDAIGEQGRSDLARVRAAAQRMGDLIDALLSLTSVARARVVREETDLSAIAASVVAALEEAEPGRVVEVSIRERVVARTDQRLAAVVLENLLANAWKFTAHSSPARIAFDETELDGRRVYSVSDNGVGFDAAYTDKLFRPFQRLHTVEEFPGTGIGLATVGRALDRLGGEYWAEGSPGAGATVYFTLP